MSKQNVEDIYPLSPSQQGMLLYLLLSGYTSEVYFDQYVATLEGRLDLATWRRAWQRVLDRHTALRTMFLWERRDQPLQIVRRGVELPWQDLDWSRLPEPEREERLAAFLRADEAEGFDLRKPPLMRVATIRWSAESWKLVWSFSHIIVDGWSMAILLSEVLAVYQALSRGEEPRLAPARPYRAYIDWLQRQDVARAETFWRRTLAGFSSPTPVPFDGTGTGGEVAGRAARDESLTLGEETVRRLQELARRHEVTLNTLLQGAWGLLLRRFTGNDDLLFGGVVSGRPPAIEGIDGMVGMLINALPVRLQIDPERPLGDWLREIQGQQIDQREYEYVPFEQIQAWSEIEHGVRVFETLLVFENYPVSGLEGSGELGFEVREALLTEANNHAMTLFGSPNKGGLELKISYHWTRVSAAAAGRLLEALAALLADMAARPDARLGELAALSPAETRELLAAGTGLRPQEGAACVHSLVAAAAARAPEAVAVEQGDLRLTYGELEARASRLAGHLRRLGVGAESIVGLAVERSPDLLVAMLGVLKAGAAYLPLDPNYPRERMALMLEDSGARVLLTQERLGERLPETAARVVRLDADWPQIAAGEPLAGDGPALPQSPAYVIYTSGSTGRPKGVLVPHAPLVNYVRGVVVEYGIGPADRVLQFAAVSFDTSAEEIYSCLLAGGTLVLRDDAMIGSLDGFARAVERLRITVLDLPTAYWHELVAEVDAQGLDLPAGLRLVILGGEEALADRLALWWRRVGDRVRLVNTYGPTEATIVSTHCDLTDPAALPSRLPIGRAVPNARTYVLDRRLELLPRGVDGELYIGGAGLARGYLGRPDLTAERFVPNPFAPEDGAAPGERLYRTGDLVRLLEDGTLQFRGRADHQVKVRGFRVELGEIEAALRRVEGVREAVVAMHGAAGGQRLVAWVAAASGAVQTAGLRAALKETLPEYMIPAAFVVLEALPLTAGGKVDRRALPAPDNARPEVDTGYAAPRNPVQEVLAGIWSELLNVERVGIDDDFFQLGGHSLLVARLAARVRQAFGAELSMVEVFKNPTIAALAAAVERAGEAPPLPPVRRAPRDRPLPLSFPQERIWFLNQLVENNLAYNFQMTLWFQGELDFPALEGSLTEMVRRHEIFRTTFPAVDGQPVQVIHPPSEVRLPVVDLRALPEPVREEVSERLVHEATQRGFDVTRLPLVRWTLLRLEDDLHELIQVEHHFVHDGWSLSVFLRELQTLYGAFHAGLPSPLPELPIQFADFAAWQREWMQGEVMAAHLDFWSRRLEGCPPVLDLPTDRPRPRVASLRGAAIRRALPAELYDALRRVSRQQGFTLYMTMLAAFNLLLHRYTGQTDIPVGAGVANRRLREAELLIGMVVNSMVLRNDLSGDPTFRELLARVREVTLSAYAHQDMPFERLVERLQPQRDPSRNPLFQVMFSFHDSAVPDLDFAGLRTGFLVRHNRTAKTDLNVIVVPRAEQRVGRASADDRALLIWEYSADLFEPATMERMVSHYLSLLAAAAAQPQRPVSELPLLSPEERQEILAGWNDTRRDYPSDATLAELFERQVARSPEAIAAICGEDRVTYLELLRRAGRLAARLRRLGVRHGDLTGLCVERSVEMVVGMLGILEAGAAYVPLDLSYPDERLAFMLEDLRQAQGRPPVVVTAGTPPAAVLASGLPMADLLAEAAGEAAEPAPATPAGTADDLAYVIYTSGSTGKPKGVAVPQRAVARLVLGTDYVHLGPDDRIAQASNTAFDAATFEVWGALLNGGCAVVIPREDLLAPAAFAQALRREGITTLFLTTALFNQMAREAPGCFGTLRQVLFGGEAVDPRWVAEVLGHRPPARLLHVYGPTESTTFATWELVRAVAPGAATVPIGRPIANTRAHVLDRYLEPVSAGVAGELYIGGDGLARGYLIRPELTAERFVPDPFGALADEPGGRLYRTGDLVRYLADGRIEFLGRNDFQVKIRGFRIELPEVEAVIAEHPAVREVAALAREDRSGERRLVAYVVAGPDGDAADLPSVLRGYLERKVPAYMVPSAFVVLPALPLTPNGKLDRRALPAPDEARDESSFVAPRTAVEEIVAEIWREVLGVERVGVRDDFFLLGGHSLSAARVLSRVRDALAVDLPLIVIFEAPTVEGMAEAVAATGRPAPAESLAIPPFAPEEQALLATAAELPDADLDALLAQMMTEEKA
jgi:amino acid adenylation domain-containing protein